MRQPVHTVYGGANLFVPGVCQKLGRLAIRSLDENGPFPGIGEDLEIRVRNKLRNEPIEDYRIDFEDGYGVADLFDLLESKRSLPEGSLKFEFLVETPPALLLLPRILEAARGRCTAAHFGAYDYMASIDIAATRQHLHHPACGFARNMMQAAYSGRGIFLADGATNIMPAGDRAAVRRGWDAHFADVRHSLDSGFYQGWDLHPAQLVSRYAAVYSFFREGWEALAERLRNYKDRPERSTLTGNQFDDAATVRGLIDHLDRAIHCGAISRSEIEAIAKHF